MADQNATGAGASLGVGGIISESFSILFGNLLKVIFIAFIPMFLTLAFAGPDQTSTNFDLGVSGNIGITGAVSAAVLVVLLVIAFYSLITAVLVQLAYDVKLDRSGSIATYFARALSAIIPITILAIASGILMVIGFIFLVVPGLWIYAVFYVFAAVAVIERAGFGSLGRSAELTKEYRWPIVGLVLVVGIIASIIQNIAEYMMPVLTSAFGGETLGWIIAIIVSSAIGAIGYGLGGISVALTYARLREIKEGVSVDEIASVFD